MSPYESKFYVKLGPKDTGIKKKIYDQVLARGVEFNKKYKMVRGMIMRVKLCINKVRKQDRDAGEMETIDGKQYISLNILIDSGADEGIIDTET